MEITFSEWLENEINKKGWTWNRLAKAANLSSGTIYNIRDGTRGAGRESLTAIAKALQLPVETVYRAANFLETKSENELVDEAANLLKMLDEAEKLEIIEIATRGCTCQ